MKRGDQNRPAGESMVVHGGESLIESRPGLFGQFWAAVKAVCV